MSGYRDETEALKARNESLEGELASAKAELARLKGQYDVVPVASAGGSGLGCAIATAAFMFVGISGAALFFMLRHREVDTAVAMPPAQPLVVDDERRLTSPTTPGGPWEGAHGAILLDLNDDGTPDIIGRVRYMPGDDTVHAAAFDGKTGKEMWETPSLGPYISTLQGKLAASKTTLFFANDGGSLAAFDTKSGHKRWETILPERATRMCTQVDVLSVRLADGKIASFGASDGVALPNTAEPANCVELPSDEAKRSRGPLVDHDVKVDGMSTTMSVLMKGGPKVAVGTRAPGTPVPMVAAVFDDPSRNWKVELAEKDALLSRETIPETGVAVTERGIFSLYTPTSSIEELHLVAFDFAGHHLWDVAFSGRSPFESLQADDEAVFVSQWGRLGAYDPATGKLLFEIGKGLFP